MPIEIYDPDEWMDITPEASTLAPTPVPAFPVEDWKDVTPAVTPIAKPKVTDYSDIITRVSQAHGVDEALIKSVIKAESDFRPRAVSKTGAQGLMQLMPDTAKELGVIDPFDPEQNIMAGTKYLAQNLERFGGDMSLALAAYNAGARNVEEFGGIPAFPETQKYIGKVLESYEKYKKPPEVPPEIPSVETSTKEILRTIATTEEPPSFMKEVIKPTLKEIGRGMIATPETAYSLLEGMIVWPISKVAGLTGLIAGEQEMKRREEATARWLTHKPIMEEAAEAGEIVGKGFEFIETPQRMASEELEGRGYYRAAYLTKLVSDLAMFKILHAVGTKAKGKIIGESIPKNVPVSKEAIDQIAEVMPSVKEPEMVRPELARPVPVPVSRLTETQKTIAREAIKEVAEEQRVDLVAEATRRRQAEIERMKRVAEVPPEPIEPIIAKPLVKPIVEPAKPPIEPARPLVEPERPIVKPPTEPVITLAELREKPELAEYVTKRKATHLEEVIAEAERIIKPEEPVPVEKVKEPWEMTKEEFVPRTKTIGPDTIKRSAGTLRIGKDGIVEILREIKTSDISVRKENKIYAAQVEKYKKTYSNQRPVVMIEKDGRIVVDDGHHRFIADKDLGKKTSLVWVRDATDYPRSTTHKFAVQQALSEGKPIPEKVLKEYAGEKWADEAIAKIEKPPEKPVPPREYRGEKAPEEAAAFKLADELGLRFESYATPEPGVVGAGYMFSLTEKADPLFRGKEDIIGTSFSVEKLSDLSAKAKAKIEEFKRVAKEPVKPVAPPEVPKVPIPEKPAVGLALRKSKEVSFSEYREIKKGKHKGRIRVTWLDGKWSVIDKADVLKWPERVEAIKKPRRETTGYWEDLGYTKPTAKSMTILADAIEYSEGHPGRPPSLTPWSVRLSKEAAGKLGRENQYITRATDLHFAAKKWQEIKAEVVIPEKARPRIFRMTEPTKIVNTRGKEITLPKGEEFMAYDIGKGKIRLQDGKQVTIYEGELSKLKGQMLPLGEEPMAGMIGRREPMLTIKERDALRIKLRAEAKGARTALAAGKRELAKLHKAKMREIRERLKAGFAARVAKIKTTKEILQRRRSKIRAVQEHFGLSDVDLRSITKRDIRLMNNLEFKTFIADIRIKAEKFAERQQAKNELIAHIKEKELDVENLRKAMKLPTIKNMTTEQFRKLDKALDPYKKRDVFLSVRKLETVDRTELKGIKTWREARERLSKTLGVPVEQLQSIKVSEFDRFRYETGLAERNPFYGMMVEETAKRMLTSQAEYLKIETETFALAKKIKPKGLLRRLIPQQKRVREFMEAPTEKKADIKLTGVEAELAEYMTKHFSEAREYLIQIEAMRMGRENYFTHVRRGILEAIKEDGIVKAVKEQFESYKLDEQGFNILDRETGEILAMDKFFKFAMHRVGKIKPTENVVRAFLTYMRTFKKKQALDEITPLIDIYAHALTPRGMTKKGLLLHGNLIRFVKEWINTQKGRHITLAAKQNGKVDGALRAIKMFTSLRDLGLNIPVSLATEIGEQVTTYQLLGKKKFAVGKFRQRQKQGKAIIEKYRSLIGKNPWKELVEPSKEIGDRLMEGIFILFRDASVRANKTFLLGALSKAEFKAGEIAPARLAALKTELGRYRMVEGMSSIIGATPEGKAYTQYKRWAIPILRTTVKNLNNLRKKITPGQKVTSAEFKKSALELYRLTEVTAFVMLAFSMTRDEDDRSFMGKIANKAYREASTLIQALQPRMFLYAGRTVSFVEELGVSLTLLLKAEEYKTKEGYKGIQKLKRQVTPVAISQFRGEKKKEPIRHRAIRSTRRTRRSDRSGR